ncbi:hypothetical protein HZA44_00660 [Candidatus Peregrinibacteria bacterium]|nr:hypothetical protein [Candidatus Peregrinibacteria bacterium]
MQLSLFGNHRKGETILETVIAMGILAVGISLASTIVGSSLRSINASKNRIIAISIAREGLEAIRNIRDTNWLKFNSTKRECWNHMPVAGMDTCVNANSPIPPGEYIVYKQTLTDPIDPTVVIGWKWRLEDIKVPNEFDTPPPGPGPGAKATYYNRTDRKTYTWNGTAWVDLTQLYLVDADPVVDSDNDHNYTNDPDAYNHALVEEDNAFGKDFARKSVFRRSVVIDYMDNDGNPPVGADLTPYNRMRIRSKVVWQEGKFEFKTDLATTLTDYQGRENLSN